MSYQHFYDATLAHIRKQGRPAFVPSLDPKMGAGSCRYRLRRDDGVIDSCAIGGVVPDPVWPRSFLPFTSPVRVGELPDAVQDFVIGLIDPGNRAASMGFADVIQRAHDMAAYDTVNKGADFMEGFELRMKNLAEGDWSDRITYTAPEVA